MEEKVFAIDFDEKAVRVARTLNLIAGDGQTNILHLNTLDYELWDEITKEDEWQSVYFPGFNRLKKLRPKGSKDYREFQFDVLMANPPFAGDIKEPRMISRYDLAKKPDGKWQTKVGRDILFIERNLDFLKPGGRMAIVLPQGRFNNSSDKNIRDFIAERCRILAVVGLHGNTFRPHTGTKTSVLFVQKWNDDPKVGALCPRRDDYNIFFATMQKSGKDNSGEKIWRRVASPPEIPPTPLEKGGLESDSPLFKGGRGGSDLLQDEHGHLIVDHDLYNHEGLTEDGIAEAFIEFAKKEKLSFFEIPPANATPLNKGGRGGSFDAVLYQQLMDGLEAVELSLNEVLQDNDITRIDAVFYNKLSVSIENKLKDTPHFFLKQKEIVSGPFGSTLKSHSYQDVGIPFVRVENLKSRFEIDQSEIVYISEEDNLKLKNSQLFVDDLALSKVGNTIGYVARVDEAMRTCNISENNIGIKLSQYRKAEKHYILAFFNSFYGQNLIVRRISGNAQPKLNVSDLSKIPIPTLNQSFYGLISLLVEEAKKYKLSSLHIYQQAEYLLLSELDLQDWQPTEETVAVKSFAESFLSSGRFDAEYYQPKYDQLLEIIESTAVYTRQIKDIKKHNARGLQPVYSENGNLNVVNSRHILEEHLDYENLERTDIEYWSSQEKSRIYRNDILIYTTGANIGRTNVYLSEEKALASNHVNILRLKEEAQIYVGFVINSLIGRLQTEKLSAGSAQAELYPKDIDNFIIPFISKEKQERVINQYVLSLERKQESKQLLEIAKTGVERAIETDEATATAWINQQLEALGLSPLFKGGRGDLP